MILIHKLTQLGLLNSIGVVREISGVVRDAALLNVHRYTLI